MSSSIRAEVSSANNDVKSLSETDLIYVYREQNRPENLALRKSTAKWLYV